MTPDTLPHQVGALGAPTWSASWWLRLGQAILFVGLLGLALLLAVARGAGWPVVAASAAVVLVFGAGLALHHRLGPIGRIVWVSALFAGTTWLMLVAPEFLWAAFPLWLLAAATLPMVAALLLTAVTLAVIVTVLTWTAGHTVGAVLGPLVGALVAISLARGVLLFEHEASEHRRLVREVLRAESETARLQREAGVLAERTRLAHDIHDTLAQGFSSVVLLARAAAREPDADRVRALVAQIESTASDQLADARRVVYALAPDEPGAGGLAAPLRRLTAEVADAVGATWSVRVDPDVPRLPTPWEVALLRAAQGSLANVRQHAHATRIAVELAHSGEEIRLDVVDDGVGFDLGRLGLPTLEGGYGIQALRERLAALGGGLEVESEPGAGTAVSVRLPLVAPSTGTP